MPANVLADNIISALGNVDNPADANLKIANEITNYLKNNTSAIVSYAGTTPVGAPLVLVDTFKITGSCAPANATQFDAWLMQLVMNIQTGFQLQTVGTLGVTMAAPTLCFTPSPSPFVQNQLTLGLKGLHEGNKDNPAKAVWTAIGNSIIMWLNTIAMIPAPTATYPIVPNVPVPPSCLITKIIVL